MNSSKLFFSKYTSFDGLPIGHPSKSTFKNGMGWVGLNKMAYPPRPNPTHENPCPFTQSGISDLILKKPKISINTTKNRAPSRQRLQSTHIESILFGFSCFHCHNLFIFKLIIYWKKAWKTLHRMVYLY
jgi:hypothetical protein